MISMETRSNARRRIVARRDVRLISILRRRLGINALKVAWRETPVITSGFAIVWIALSLFILAVEDYYVLTLFGLASLFHSKLCQIPLLPPVRLIYSCQ